MAIEILDRLVAATEDGKLIAAGAIDWGNTEPQPPEISTTLIHGTGANTLWSMAVPVATTVTVEVDADCYAGTNAGIATKKWRGVLSCVASRAGSGALSIDTQAAGVPWVLTDSSWNPRFNVSGNTLQLLMTADTASDVLCNLAVSVKTKSTADSPAVAVDPLVAARATVLADGPSALYYADVGVLPGGLVTDGDAQGWQDQSASGGHHVTFYSGRYPKLRNIGGIKSLEFLQAAALYSTVAGTVDAVNSYTLRFTYTGTANGTAGLLFNRPETIISIHSGTSWNNDGANIVAGFGGAYHVLGAMQDGTHCYEIRVNKPALTAQLFVDGVAAAAPVSFDVINAPSAPFSLGWASTSQFATGKMHGWCIQESIGDATQMAHWNTMSHLAWGSP
jgi:hypothetical protein